jgi:arginine decarboxylase
VLRDEFLSAEACHALDPLHVVIDVSARGIVGYDAADWLREHQRFAMGMSDHHRIEATVSVADDHQSAARLVTALSALTCSAAAPPPAKPVAPPSAAGPELEPVMLPRDAFFAAKQTAPANAAAGCICAEQITRISPAYR